jgi:hypothetical protein
LQTRPLLARKRPVMNEAWQYDGRIEVADLIVNWIDTNGGYSHVHPYEDLIIIQANSGDLAVKPGDWVIRDQFNDFYPCPDETFQTVYVPGSQG